MDADSIRTLMSQGETVDLDWKRTFPPTYFSKNKDEKNEAVGEFVKDVAALNNAASTNTGRLIYGISDKNGERNVFHPGRKIELDEATIRSQLKRYLDPLPDFSYADILIEGESIGAFELKRVMPYPSVVKESVGKIYKGQVFFRTGTMTELALYPDLKRMFADEEPFALDNDRQLPIINALQTDGWHVISPYWSKRDQYRLEGYSFVYFPGTRRPVVQAWDGRIQTVLMKRPRREGDI